MRIMRAVRIMAHVRAVRVVAGKQCAASITVKPEHIQQSWTEGRGAAAPVELLVCKGLLPEMRELHHFQ